MKYNICSEIGIVQLPILVVLIVGIMIGLVLVSQQQTLRSRADEVAFVEMSADTNCGPKGLPEVTLNIKFKNSSSGGDLIVLKDGETLSTVSANAGTGQAVNEKGKHIGVDLFQYIDQKVIPGQTYSYLVTGEGYSGLPVAIKAIYCAGLSSFSTLPSDETASNSADLSNKAISSRELSKNSTPSSSSRELNLNQKTNNINPDLALESTMHSPTPVVKTSIKTENLNLFQRIWHWIMSLFGK